MYYTKVLYMIFSYSYYYKAIFNLFLSGILVDKYCE